jgi:uncharacterized protein YciI
MPEFLIISNLIVDRQQTAPYREEHREYLSNLKQENKLILAGKFTNGKGGIYIISASSQKEAEQIAFGDPYHKNSLRSFSIVEWERKL